MDESWPTRTPPIQTGLIQKLPLPTLGVGSKLNILENIKYFGWFILLGSTYELVLYVQTSYNGFFLQAL